MKIKAIAFLFSLVIAPSFAASDFSCEKIKEKVIRNSCIASRDEASSKKKASDAASEERAATESRRAELDEFVAKSKRLLTQNYRDPQGAQFQDLVVAETKIDRTLCGSVNGKNSYGAFVGYKRFTVHWWTDPRMSLPPDVWNEGESTKDAAKSNYAPALKAALELNELEMSHAKSTCSASETTTVTAVK